MLRNLLISIFFLGSLANAAEDTKFLWKGEYRSRGLLQDNTVNSGQGRDDVFSHRLKLDAEFEPNDRLDAVISAIIFQGWGEDVRGFGGIAEESGAENLRIYEAYGEWHLSSAFFLKFGRWALDFGNGALVSKNMDDDVPYSMDGAMVGYDSSNFELRLGGLRVGDWSSSLGVTADPDSSAYFVSLNLKSWEPVFEFFQLYFFREQKDAYNNAATGTSFSAESSNHFGVSAAGKYKRLYYNGDYVQYSGEFTDSNTSIDGFMVHTKFGAILKEKNDFGLYLVFHYDTGDEASSAATSEFYRPLFYNHHKYAGVLDLISWGNLTYVGLGAHIAKNKKNKFSLQALSFSRTSEDDGIRSIGFSGFDGATDFINQDIATNSSASTATDIGLEIDFTYTRDFSSGLSFEFIAGALFVGDYLEAYGRNKDVLGLRATVSMAF